MHEEHEETGSEMPDLFGDGGSGTGGVLQGVLLVESAVWAGYTEWVYHGVSGGGNEYAIHSIVVTLWLVGMVVVLMHPRFPILQSAVLGLKGI